MAQPPHFTMDGAVYFVTTRLYKEGMVLDAGQLEAVCRTVQNAASNKELILYAYVVMPDHMHILFKPEPNSLSKTMQLIKGRSSRLLGPGVLWQKGFFDYAVVTEAKFKEKFNYIHRNPVKKGLAVRAEEYAYSSAREYQGLYGEAFYR